MKSIKKRVRVSDAYKTTGEFVAASFAFPVHLGADFIICFAKMGNKLQLQSSKVHPYGVQKKTKPAIRNGTDMTVQKGTMPLSRIATEVRHLQQEIDEFHATTQDRLKNLDFFILDNSIRESTVGQLRSHTLQNKIDIFKQVKRCGLKHVIVATFAHMTRVDDDFCQYLKDNGEDFSDLYSFSEITEGLTNGSYDTERMPIALAKNHRYGLRNIIFEMDLFNPDCDWDGKWTIDDQFKLLMSRIQWARNNIDSKGRFFINFRDLTNVMPRAPDRLLKLVHMISSLPPAQRVYGLMYEDMGEAYPEETAAWTASVRRVMDGCNWQDGLLLFHVHERWDLQTAATLKCLERGANGIWASLCEEGAAVGHASTTVTTLNLIRTGNTKVLDRYNCLEMREAAREITKITTGSCPHPRQVVYGDRAVDMVFGLPAQVFCNFNMATFFGLKQTLRMSTFATVNMIRSKLVEDFGENEAFTDEVAAAMKDLMLEDLRSGRKEEYMSKVGIALLFDRAGGKINKHMSDVIAKVEIKDKHHKILVEEIHRLWKTWDLAEAGEAGDDRLKFDSFYHGFMSPYFGCYRCESTRQALQAVDMDNDGRINWTEFLVYIKWALNEYPEVDSADDLLEIAFQKGIIPAMRDEKVTRLASVSSA